MQFVDKNIEGVVVRPLKRYADRRGWLCEVIRRDETMHTPLMSYISVTFPGIARGPHEHVTQSDYFGFLGPGDFRVVMWDNRKNSPTFKGRMVVSVGEKEPCAIIVPPGVVHGYRNIGTCSGYVLNYPNALYAGEGKKEAADEVRHEDDPASPFVVDFNKL